MADKLSLPLGYSNDGVVNQEEMMLVVEDKPMKPPISSSSSSTVNVWPTVKPFANGGLAGLLRVSTSYYVSSLYHLANIAADTESAAQFKKSLLSNQAYNTMLKRMPGMLLAEVIYTSMQLGPFEILTRKVEAANKGMPGTLYQEACCGLISGVIAACIGAPIGLAYSRMVAEATHTNVLQVLYHTAADKGILALWKGGRYYTNALVALNMGMLASYNRSFSFFRESLGLNENGTILGASAVSGFFASACSIPYMRIHHSMRNMRPDANGKYPYTSSLDCALKILESGGPLAFFRGFPKYFMGVTPRAMLVWIFLEDIRKYEETVGL